MHTKQFLPFINDEYDFTLCPDMLLALQMLECKYAMERDTSTPFSQADVMQYLTNYAIRWGEDFLGGDFKPEMLTIQASSASQHQ